MTQALGEQPVVDPALVPGVVAAVPDEQNDDDDNQQLDADEREFPDCLFDIRAQDRDQDCQAARK